MNYYYRAPQEKWETEKEKGKDRQETPRSLSLLWCLWSEVWPRKAFQKGETYSSGRREERRPNLHTCSGNYDSPLLFI